MAVGQKYITHLDPVGNEVLGGVLVAFTLTESLACFIEKARSFAGEMGELEQDGIKVSVQNWVLDVDVETWDWDEINHDWLYDGSGSFSEAIDAGVIAVADDFEPELDSGREGARVDLIRFVISTHGVRVEANYKNTGDILVGKHRIGFEELASDSVVWAPAGSEVAA